MTLGFWTPVDSLLFYSGGSLCQVCLFYFEVKSALASLLAPLLPLNFALGKVSLHFCPLTFGRGLSLSRVILCHASVAPRWIKGQSCWLLTEYPAWEGPSIGSSCRRLAAVDRETHRGGLHKGLADKNLCLREVKRGGRHSLLCS